MAKNTPLLPFMVIAAALSCRADLALGENANAWVPDYDVVGVVDTAATAAPVKGGSVPLASYARYYWGSFTGDRPIIQGIMVSTAISTPPPPMPTLKGMMTGKLPDFVFIVPQSAAPSPEGGGCNVVHINYDVQSRRLLKAYCNPMPANAQPPALTSGK